MKKLSVRLLLAFAVVTTGAVHAADDAAGNARVELEDRRAAAEAALDDHTYYARWSQPGAVATVEAAQRAKAEGSEVEKRIDAALKVMKTWCNTRVLVNACYQDARDRHREVKREVRKIAVAADDVIRDDHTKKHEARVAKEVTHKPVKVSGGRRSDAGEPSESHAEDRAADVKANLERAEVRRQQEEENLRAYEEKQKNALSRAQEGHDPIKVNRNAKTKSSSSPMELHLGQDVDKVEANHQRAEVRRSQEEANQAQYDEKQAAAAKRLADAEATAAKRRAEREAKRKDFNKTLKERNEAQERYEATKNDRQSGLGKYF